MYFRKYFGWCQWVFSYFCHHMDMVNISKSFSPVVSIRSIIKKVSLSGVVLLFWGMEQKLFRVLCNFQFAQCFKWLYYIMYGCDSHETTINVYQKLKQMLNTIRLICNFITFPAFSPCLLKPSKTQLQVCRWAF